ncbi:cell division protein FtsL [Buchnera aphidicola (Aphis helianthi)]|uniref:Cell division protein FtsL n=1 Tax=Buchnera aphidicola (Aphis helianthi) TaxID=2315802 RepID=A0A4D6XR83_9GAMM|nr:cell division protein FtsL [Buchnera aphidicola]QCI17050.1 cell division protein FtsL [Buchnera aphidicola (Aphis helianthi)]
MNTKQHYDLPNIIKNDFLLYFKIHLILLFAIILSANSIVIIVYKTRMLINEEEQLHIEKNKKNDEWRNLIIEKNTLDIPEVN